MPEVKSQTVCLLVLKLPGDDSLAATALNFGRSAAAEDVDLSQTPGVSVARLRGEEVMDAVAGGAEGAISESGRLRLQLTALSGKTLVIHSAPRYGEVGRPKIRMGLPAPGAH